MYSVSVGRIVRITAPGYAGSSILCTGTWPRRNISTSSSPCTFCRAGGCLLHKHKPSQRPHDNAQVETLQHLRQSNGTIPSVVVSFKEIVKQKSRLQDGKSKRLITISNLSSFTNPLLHRPPSVPYSGSATGGTLCMGQKTEQSRWETMANCSRGGRTIPKRLQGWDSGLAVRKVHTVRICLCPSMCSCARSRAETSYG